MKSLNLLKRDEKEIDLTPPPIGLRKIVIILTAIVGVLGVAGWAVQHSREEKAKVVAAQQKAEREWLVKERVEVASLGQVILGKKDEVDAIARANSEPKRKGGKVIPQEKWSSLEVTKYNEAKASLAQLMKQRQERVAPYNQRLEQYRGPWPDGVKKPDALKIS